MSYEGNDYDGNHKLSPNSEEQYSVRACFADLPMKAGCERSRRDTGVSNLSRGK
jgi:hypothetical protein